MNRLIIPEELTELRHPNGLTGSRAMTPKLILTPNGKTSVVFRDKYGCQPYDDLKLWLCFRGYVEDWIEENMRLKSRIRLRGHHDTKWNDYHGTTQTQSYSCIYFGRDSDAIHFKMRWL